MRYITIESLFYCGRETSWLPWSRRGSSGTKCNRVCRRIIPGYKKKDSCNFSSPPHWLSPEHLKFILQPTSVGRSCIPPLIYSTCIWNLTPFYLPCFSFPSLPFPSSFHPPIIISPSSLCSLPLVLSCEGSWEVSSSVMARRGDPSGSWARGAISINYPDERPRKCAC